jgi:hypothetical protein
MKHTWLWRMLRRLGRIGMGFVAFLAGFAAFWLATMISAVVTNAWYVKVCAAVGIGTTLGVFALLDRFDLVPDDSDPATTLSLSQYSSTAGSESNRDGSP